MKTTKLILLIIGIIGFVIINIGNKTTVAKGEFDLLALASILQDENILITEWSLHAREKMENVESLEQVQNFTENLKQQYSNWEWTSKSYEKHLETVAFLNSNAQNETIKILTTPTKGQVQTYLIYEVKGKGWHEKVEKNISKQLQSRISDIFRGNATFFSCLKGEFNDKIDKTLSNEMDHLLTAFNAEEVEALSEENFISTSAYSTKFDKSIATKSKDMNLQIAIRNQGLGGETNLVVGTPIITIEY
ncbi:YwmB family TATA-box binding protein [Bacillus sp. FJAT-49705]|uniref:YwmB family TATA-box binding protein n=1 Tax=Cytobacillus citreus TaxID=2833586 RepID=A0ABS5NQL4_9BACI|nr:YwmB family TATA-box binding protein [Cytobacillus citreus]MBS4190110.1 YwmB family TATA-box binding protein [Cytobacillus citreus]